MINFLILQINVSSDQSFTRHLLDPGDEIAHPDKKAQLSFGKITLTLKHNYYGIKQIHPNHLAKSHGSPCVDTRSALGATTYTPAHNPHLAGKAFQ